MPFCEGLAQGFSLQILAYPLFPVLSTTFWLPFFRLVVFCRAEQVSCEASGWASLEVGVHRHQPLGLPTGGAAHWQHQGRPLSGWASGRLRCRGRDIFILFSGFGSTDISYAFVFWKEQPAGNGEVGNFLQTQAILV